MRSPCLRSFRLAAFALAGALACNSPPASDLQVAPSSDAGPKGAAGELSAKECESLFDAATKELAARRTNVQCERDDECVLAMEWPCWAVSSKAVGMRKSDLPGWTAAYEHLRATTCKRWQEARCFSTTPPAAPTTAPQWAACIDRKCTASTSPRK